MRQHIYQPCIPTRGTEVPARDDWFHEVKHDGYRLIVYRQDRRVRLFTRQGYDWSDRNLGEAVVLRPDGVSDFGALQSRRRNSEVRLYAFDLLMDNGVDMRDEPLRVRKIWLEKLLKKISPGILLNEHEAGAVGPDLFRHACKLGLEGIVSKHRDRAYRAGKSPNWIKVKNPMHPSMTRGDQWNTNARNKRAVRA